LRRCIRATTTLIWLQRGLGERLLGLEEILGEACTARQIGHSQRPPSQRARALTANEHFASSAPSARSSVPQASIRELGRMAQARSAAMGCTSIRAATTRSHCRWQQHEPVTHKAPACYHKGKALVGHLHSCVFRSSDSADARVNANLKEAARRCHKGNAAKCGGL
jgi:hypothetical protein